MPVAQSHFFLKPPETPATFPTSRHDGRPVLVRTQKANTPARRGWNADRAQPFLVIAARDASSISDDRQKSGQVLVRTEPIIQMILGRFRGGMSGVLNFAFDKRNTLFYSCVDETQDQETETEEHGKQLAYDR